MYKCCSTGSRKTLSIPMHRLRDGKAAWCWPVTHAQDYMAAFHRFRGQTSQQFELICIHRCWFKEGDAVSITEINFIGVISLSQSFVVSLVTVGKRLFHRLVGAYMWVQRLSSRWDSQWHTQLQCVTYTRRTSSILDPISSVLYYTVCTMWNWLNSTDTNSTPGRVSVGYAALYTEVHGNP